MRYGYRRSGTFRRRSNQAVAMTARKPGPCAACDVPIRPGDAIYWWPNSGAAFHQGCTGDGAPAPSAADPALARAVSAGLGEDHDESAAGYAEARRRRMEREVYGEALAESWHIQEDHDRFWKFGIDD